MAIRAVVLDVGGVLEVVDDTSWPEAWLGDWARRLGLTRQQVDQRLEAAGLAAVGTGVGTERRYMATFQRALGLRDDQLCVMFADMWDRYCGRLDTALMRYVETLVPAYRLAIISNSADGARREEERRYGFSRHFDPIVYSHEEGVEKPDPAIFELTCKRLDVCPEEVAFVDDAAANVAAARRLGMTALLHRRTSETIERLRWVLGGSPA